MWRGLGLGLGPGKDAQRRFKRRLWFCSPNVSHSLGWYSHFGHIFVLLGWLVIWLGVGGTLKVPARPLVRKLQKAVSQRQCARPPYGTSVPSDAAGLGGKTER